MALWRVTSAAAIFGLLVDATPTITFPLNSQVPPVARISEPFLCTFSTSTFFSTLPLTYSLIDAPKWLSLDNATRTLSGTPTLDIMGMEEILGVPFGLSASDASGSITLNATLVVSKTPAPAIVVPLSTQLESFGTISQPSTILYHPSTSSQISFSPDTFSFSSSSSGMFYYAVTTNNTPLPAWIYFDGNTLSLSGQTPDYYSLIGPPQTFGIQLIASDVEGFAGTPINFDIEVGVHSFAFKDQTISINTTSGDTVDIDGLLGSLFLDGQLVNAVDIVSATAENLPSLMKFDHTTLILSGTVPIGAAPSNIIVRVTDRYADTVTAFVFVDLHDSSNTTSAIFAISIGSLNATIGSTFSYDLGKYVNNESDTSMNAEFSSPETWLSFDPHSFLLTGEVPPSAQPSVILVTLNASSISHHSTDSQSFLFSINEKLSNSSSASPIPTATASSFPNNSTHGLSKKVILAISIPIGVAAIALLLAIFCYFHRRHAAQRIKGSPSKSDICSPIEGRSSTAQIIRPGRLNPPEPLHLDTTGFVIGAVDAKQDINKRVSQFPANADIRRSQSMKLYQSPLIRHFKNRLETERELSQTTVCRRQTRARVRLRAAHTQH